MSAQLRRLGLLLSVLFALSMAPIARADTVARAPVAPDVPLIDASDSIVLPALPASYEVQRLGWWTLEYPAALRERMRALVESADAWKGELVQDLGQDVLREPITVRIARTWDDMTALVPRELGVLPYAAGETYLPPRLILVSLTEPVGAATDLETVFHHELAHVALHDAVGGRHVPLWFNEGTAIHESGEHPVLRMKELWDATLFRQLLPLAELDRRFPERQDEVNIAYAESADVLRFLLRGKDHQRFVSLIDRVRAGTPFDRALGDAYGTDVRTLEYQWREDTAKKHTFAPMLASGSFIWVIGFGALILGYRRRKKQAQATLARWEREEALERAPPAHPASEEDAAFPDPARVLAGLPKIEHDGRWHTLH